MCQISNITIDNTLYRLIITRNLTKVDCYTLNYEVSRFFRAGKVRKGKNLTAMVWISNVRYLYLIIVGIIVFFSYLDKTSEGKKEFRSPERESLERFMVL